MSNADCRTCEASHKKCDRTRGPNGCRRCAKAGIECGGYLPARTPKSTRGIRDERPTVPDLASNTSNPAATWSSGGNRFAAPLHWPDSSTMDRPYGQVPTPPTERLATPPLSQASSLPADGSPPLRHMLTTPIEATGIDGPITPPSSSSNSVLSTSELSHSTWAPQSPGSLARDLVTATNQLAYLDQDINPEDPKNLQVELLSGLVLDRQVQSNMVSFLVHSFTSWMSRFLFEPTRVIPLFRESIVRGHSYGHEAHQRMILIANSVLNVSESTNYDLTPFTTLYNQLIKGVVGARAQGNLSRQVAVEAMQSCHEVISIMCKVCSLASILNTMNLCAPVFRRACPESSTELVNLPSILTGFDVHLKLYATMDVLLGTITSRPMYFRYDLAFPSPTTETVLNADDGPGLRWLIGVPDRLIVTLARMNTFLEEHGPRLGLVHVQALEKEIMACSTAFSSGYGTDPALALGRIVVQESWRLVASIYLYMGLCGANSSDLRVVRAQKKFMRLLAGIKPRRNPDTFLVVPLMILGVATTSPADQSIILARLWGVSECARPETLGNDMIRMLNHLWAIPRPTVWSDVRQACWYVAGM